MGRDEEDLHLCSKVVLYTYNSFYGVYNIFYIIYIDLDLKKRIKTEWTSSSVHLYIYHKSSTYVTSISFLDNEIK